MNWTEHKGVLLGGAGLAAVVFPAALLFFWDAWSARADLLEERKLLLVHEARLSNVGEASRAYQAFLTKSDRFHKQVRRLGLEPQHWERLHVALDRVELSYPEIADILDQAVPGPRHHFSPKLLEIVAPPPELTVTEKSQITTTTGAKKAESRTQPVLTLHGVFLARRGAP